jgi:hypothetical protein
VAWTEEKYGRARVIRRFATYHALFYLLDTVTTTGRKDKCWGGEEKLTFRKAKSVKWNSRISQDEDAPFEKHKECGTPSRAVKRSATRLKVTEVSHAF